MSFWNDLTNFFTSTPVRAIGGGLGVASGLGAFDGADNLFGSSSNLLDPKTLIGGLNMASGGAGLLTGKGNTLLNLGQLGLGGYNAAQGFDKVGTFQDSFSRLFGDGGKGGAQAAATTAATSTAPTTAAPSTQNAAGSIAAVGDNSTGSGGMPFAPTDPGTSKFSDLPAPKYGEGNTNTLQLKPTGPMPAMQGFGDMAGGQANNLTVGEGPVIQGNPTFDNSPQHLPQYGPESVPDPRMTPAQARTSVGDFNAVRNGTPDTKLPNVTNDFNPTKSQNDLLGPAKATGVSTGEAAAATDKIGSAVSKAGDKLWAAIEKDPMKSAMAGTMLMSAFSESPQEKAAKVYAEQMAEYKSKLDPNTPAAQQYKSSYQDYRSQQLDLAQQKAVADYAANASQRGLSQDSTVYQQGLQSINAEYDRLKSTLPYDAENAWLAYMQGLMQPLTAMSQTAAQAAGVGGAAQPQFNSTSAYLLAKA